MTGSPGRLVAPLRAADLAIDALNPGVRQGQHLLRISPCEHLLLYTLMAGAGGVVTYREFGNAMGWTGAVRHNTLARHFSSLRRKLSANGHGLSYIDAVVGVGYRFGAMPTKQVMVPPAGSGHGAQPATVLLGREDSNL